MASVAIVSYFQIGELPESVVVRHRASKRKVIEAVAGFGLGDDPQCIAR